MRDLHLLRCIALLAITRLTTPVAAQTPPQAGVDSLRLGTLTAEALRLDPQQRQVALNAAATNLRLRNIAAARLPTIAGNAQAQYQSAVTTLAVPLPGVTIPHPSRDTYDAHVNAQQSIIDPTIAPREQVERAQLAESQAQVRATVFGRRQEVNDAFFSAASLQQRITELGAAITDLESRLRETAVRFREGAALPGDTASVAATLLQRRQDLYQARADRSAALARLSELTGRAISDSATLAIPDLASNVATALSTLNQLRARPEYEQFSATRERLSRQEAAEAAQDKPRVSAFGRVGYGRPGLNMLSSTFDPYWLVGVQAQWSPWNWGTTNRNREALEVQREIIATNEAAFTESLHRGIQQSLASLVRLDSILALDDRIVALRERIEVETRAKLNENVVTASEYVDRTTDVLSARLARVQHRIQLAQARANLLTTLGVEVP
jgi:outer membrane protein TolC